VIRSVSKQEQVNLVYFNIFDGIIFYEAFCYSVYLNTVEFNKIENLSLKTWY